MFGGIQITGLFTWYLEMQKKKKCCKLKNTKLVYPFHEINQNHLISIIFPSCQQLAQHSQRIVKKCGLAIDNIFDHELHKSI